MSSPAPETSATAHVAKAKAVRQPRAEPSMTNSQRYDLLQFVKTADATAPDVELARLASTMLGRTVLKATISKYRKDFGIASVPKRSEADLLAEIARLKTALAQRAMEPVDA